VLSLGFLLGHFSGLELGVGVAASSAEGAQSKRILFFLQTTGGAKAKPQRCLGGATNIFSLLFFTPYLLAYAYDTAILYF
jgi:hypothetical protein